MVAKKKKSNRIQIKKRVKLDKIDRRKNREMRRKRTKEIKQNPVPASVLRAEKDKNLLNEIRKNTIYRQKLFESKPKDEKIEDLSPNVNKFDIILEFLDSRDPAGSSSKKLFESTKLTGKPHIKVYYNQDLVPAEILSFWREKESLILYNEVEKVNDVIQSIDRDSKINILIAANKDFDEKEFIDNRFDKEVNFSRVFTDCDESIGGILRNVCKLNYLNFERFLWSIVQKFDKNDLILKYSIPEFDSCRDFIASIAKNYNIFDERRRINYLKSAEWFLDNIRKEYKFFIDSNDNINLESIKPEISNHLKEQVQINS